ncbi:MAG: type II toxin-antitoxin system RelE/ParE family toxin [Elusimicrobiota bacterium]|nr:type II toxin-antitoxin system RelE/ParE family toxin [Elusimicrobiota bacterium]
MRKRSIIYKTAKGNEPYVEYVDSLKDREGAAKIRARVTRAELGNLGDHRSVGQGVVELRIHFGPGYRVYTGLQGKELIILLCAGDKGSQDKDIQKAMDYWSDYRRTI